MEDSLVGPKLKQRRNELNLSLRALAAETGLLAHAICMPRCNFSRSKASRVPSCLIISGVASIGRS